MGVQYIEEALTDPCRLPYCVLHITISAIGGIVFAYFLNFLILGHFNMNNIVIIPAVMFGVTCRLLYAIYTSVDRSG